ncbi:MAG: hypothetical protein IPJ77_04575 [Planctomycetes bacterium]|nr:hypothetical protein [Planctomycetota bacterium]
MTKREFEMKSDGLGIGLFAFGVFCAVLVVQAMIKGVEDEPTQFVKVVAALWVNSIGAFPSLVFNAGLAALGARLFLAGALPNLVRHLVGAGFLTASLSILCGAFGATAGGTFGARTGGALADLTHVALAALVGALAAVATVWFVWVQKNELPDEEPMTVRNPELAVATEGDEGVSNEEAEALLPVAQPLPKPVPPPSPYPEDVRKKGEIPAGTRPLGGTSNAPAIPAAAFAPSVYRWTAPGARQENAPGAASPVPATFETADEPETTDDRYTLADDEVPTTEARADAATAQKLGNLPRPVWEAGDEDPIVDAYGTPRSLVESLRKGADAEPDFEEEVSEARPLAAAKSAPVVEVDDELQDDEPLDAEPVAVVTEDDEAEADVDEDDFEPRLAEDDDDEFEDDELAEELAASAADDDEDEAEDDETTADETLVAAAVDSDDEDSDADDDDETLAARAVAPDEELDADEELAEAELVDATSTRAVAAQAEPAAADAEDEPVPTQLTDLQPAPAAVFHEDDRDDEADPTADEREALRAELRSLTFVTETDEPAEGTSLEDELARAVRALDAQSEAPATPVAEPEPVRITVSDFAAGVEAEAPAEAEPAASARAADPLEDEAPQAAVVDEPVSASSAPTPLAEEPVHSESAPELVAADEAPAELTPFAAPDTRSNGRKPKVEAPSLFDGPVEDEEPASSVFETADEPAPKRKGARRAARTEPVEALADTAVVETEPEVVLTPHPVAAELTHKTPTGTKSTERTALLAEVGCLFIDRGRVAVSMLQRQYSMDFDDACKVLDELQDMGLIGPYLGGQRRDILLSREAWLEKVGVS